MAIPGYYSLLQRGSSGPDVALVQTWLNGVRDACTWYDALKADGKFGASTQRAVQEFQLKNKMNMDGKVGQNTWNVLYTRYTAKHGLKVPYPGIVLHTPPVAPAAAANVDAHRIVSPGGQLTGGVAPGGKVHIYEVHPHRGMDALRGQCPLCRQLKLQKLPRCPCPRFRCALRRALLHHGQHRVPYPELGALVSHGIAGRPDVQPQGVGAQRCPGIQLGAPPAQPLQSAAQRKARQQVGA